MKLNSYLKSELISELRSVSKKMKEETNPAKKLFFYSAAYGMTNRVMRFEFDDELLLVDTILNITYGSINDRLRSIAQGEHVVPLTSEMIDNVADCVTEIADAIEKGKSCYDILRKLLTISYLASGPGYYQVIKGQIKPYKKKKSK